MSDAGLPSKKDEMVAFLRRLASLIESSESVDLDVVLDAFEKRVVKEKRPEKRDELLVREELDYSHLSERLLALDSRDAAVAFLTEHAPSKAALSSLARHLEVPVSKQDKVEAIRDKLVESTVGARLRSEAIRGEAGRSES